MSIFTALPPSFTKSEIKNIVSDIFELTVEIKLLESDRDQNFHLSNNGAEEFVLKIYNPSEHIKIITMQTNVLHHIRHSYSDFIEAPKIINRLKFFWIPTSCQLQPYYSLGLVCLAAALRTTKFPSFGGTAKAILWEVPMCFPVAKLNLLTTSLLMA